MIEILNLILEELESNLSHVAFSISTRIRAGWTSYILEGDAAADLISDEDILYLIHSIRGLPIQGVSTFDVELNLDNGNQLFIMGRDMIIYTVSYREQENETANTESDDWWSIAAGTINIAENTISWQGFVEDEEGDFEIKPLTRGPFE